MNYLNKLNELGLTEDTISTSLRKKIKDYKKLEGIVLGYKEDLDSGEAQGEDLELLTQSYNDASDDLNILDEDLVNSIVKFNANKDRYAEQSKNLKPKGKKVAPVTPVAPVEPQPPVEPVVPAEPAEPTEPVAPVEPIEPVVEVVEEKKNNNALGWIAGGIVAVALAAVGINYYKNNS